ncbi:MAG TPA: ABC transporter substrate-binding protein [Egibacteraceae bacterium]|jgi:branched-chain amino acid transport system substrate-binding protein|nr:ABC transporter substrate-binding protein [Egibacteraceae bacterium]
MTTRWRHRLALATTTLMLLAACGAQDDPVTEDRDTETDDTTVGDGGDGTLLLGYVLPETGDLQFLGPPMIAGTEMAVADINAAGGVLGRDVELLTGDEAGDTAVASEAAQQHLASGVDAVIGAAASAMTLAIIDAITGAEVVQCSPSNTTPTLTAYDDGGYFFRTAPTDVLQGPVLAETIVADGHTRVALLARSDDYGQGLAESTSEALAEQGAEVVAEVIYDPGATTFDPEVGEALAPDPDAVVIIGFEESAQILQVLIEQGRGPGDFPVYGGESLRSTDLPAKVDPNDPEVLSGLKGTAPTSDAEQEFIDRLRTFRDVPDTLFAAESYDCVIIVALAAQAAGTDDPSVFVDEMVAVTRDGTSCASFEECAALLEEGEDIAYAGVSGMGELNDAGEPSRGLYEVWEFVGAEIETLDEIESRL